MWWFWINVMRYDCYSFPVSQLLLLERSCNDVLRIWLTVNKRSNKCKAILPFYHTFAIPSAGSLYKQGQYILLTILQTYQNTSCCRFCYSGVHLNNQMLWSQATNLGFLATLASSLDINQPVFSQKTLHKLKCSCSWSSRCNMISILSVPLVNGSFHIN